MIEIVPLARIADTAVEALLDRAFGTDRHGRTAYRIREGMANLPNLSFAALQAGGAVGTIQCWPIRLAGDDGTNTDMIMVGPIAVEPALQQQGIGRALTAHALTAAEQLGAAGALMLIGDPEYYGRFFGFDSERTGAWRVPGPVEARRLLARGGAVPSGPGLLGPRPPMLDMALRQQPAALPNAHADGPHP